MYIVFLSCGDFLGEARPRGRRPAGENKRLSVLITADEYIVSFTLIPPHCKTRLVPSRMPEAVARQEDRKEKEEEERKVSRESHLTLVVMKPKNASIFFSFST
jgi:hypothetical protein